MLHSPSLQHQRDVQVAEIGLDPMILRSRTWDRLKFEVEYACQSGTTANSYLIQSDRPPQIRQPPLISWESNHSAYHEGDEKKLSNSYRCLKTTCPVAASFCPYQEHPYFIVTRTG